MDSYEELYSGFNLVGGKTATINSATGLKAAEKATEIQSEKTTQKC